MVICRESVRPSFLLRFFALAARAVRWKWVLCVHFPRLRPLGLHSPRCITKSTDIYFTESWQTSKGTENKFVFRSLKHLRYIRNIELHWHFSVSTFDVLQCAFLLASIVSQILSATKKETFLYKFWQCELCSYACSDCTFMGHLEKEIEQAVEERKWVPRNHKEINHNESSPTSSICSSVKK